MATGCCTTSIKHHNILQALRETGLLPYSRLLSLGTNFPNSEPLALAEIFLIQKFMSPTTEKSHMSDILYKVQMDTTIIFCTPTMITVIILLYSCTITTCTCIIQESLHINSRSFAIYVHKESSLTGLDPFLVQGIYCLQYKCQANKPLSIVVYAMYVAIHMC